MDFYDLHMKFLYQYSLKYILPKYNSEMHKIWYCQKDTQEFSPTNSLAIVNSIKLLDFNG